MTKYQLFGGFINFNGSTLNYRQFPTSGDHTEISAQLFLGKEKFYPGTANTTQPYENKYQSFGTIDICCCCLIFTFYLFNDFTDC